MTRPAEVSRPAKTAAVPVPRWLPITSIAIAVVGLLVAGYLTYEHFTASSTLACSDTGKINCLKVTTSNQSMFLHIPVAVLGMLFFVAMIPLCLPVAWRSTDPRLRRLRLAAAGVGVLFVCYLLYAELFIIDSICLWCTGVHVLTLLLFGVIAFGTAALDPIGSRRR